MGRCPTGGTVPAGLAAVIVGFARPRDPAMPARPVPAARVEIGGYIPPRQSEPPTSNNRAELAGVLAALVALRHVCRQEHCALARGMIWSDSAYVVHCANGSWKRKKNIDLWPTYDAVLAE